MRWNAASADHLRAQRYLNPSARPTLRVMENSAATARCPNCENAMTPHRLPAHYGASLVIDSCTHCHALWFDDHESTQLSPDGVVELFRVVHDAPNVAAPKWSERLPCVRCKSSLRTTRDMAGGSRFHYYRCEQGHGRLSSFYQYLTEKKFVRELSAHERAKLAAQVREIRCSGCGAPVDLAKSSACEFCRAPISVFDRDAAQKAINHYLKERNKQIPMQAPPYSSSPHTARYDDDDRYSRGEFAADVLWALARFATRASQPARSVSALPSVGAVIPTADEAIGNTVSSLGTFAQDVLTSPSAISDALPSLIGTGSLSDAMQGIDWSGGAGDAIREGVSEAVSGAAETLGDIAADSSDSLFDLVSDGVASFAESLFG